MPSLDDPVAAQRIQAGGIIGELYRSYHCGENFLEKLRQVKGNYEPRTDEEFRQMMYLINKNISKFPWKLRKPISRELRRTQKFPNRRKYSYETVICIMVADFLCGFCLRTQTRLEWHGPEDDVDTKDELELAIRLCPLVFRYIRGDHRFFDVARNSDMARHSINSLVRSSKAISFIPFLLDMHPGFRNRDMKHLPIILLTSHRREPENPERNERSLAVLVRLREKRYITEVRELVRKFVVIVARKPPSGAFDFIEKRIRLLVKWDPTMLEVQDGVRSYLLFQFYKYYAILRQRKKDTETDIRFYELVLELGFLQYRNELLGLGFHGCNFARACSLFGDEPAKRAMNDRIANELAQRGEHKNNSMMDMIHKAATDEAVHLDGLYTLIRFDPSVVKNLRPMPTDRKTLSHSISAGRSYSLAQVVSIIAVVLFSLIINFIYS